MRLPRFLGGSPKPESADIPAHGEFPAGLRLAVVKTVPGDEYPWEIITHPKEKLVSIRRLGDVDAHGPVFQMPEDHLATLVVEKGKLLHPKKLEAIRSGKWLDDFEPGTYFSAVDNNNAASGPATSADPADVYTMPHAEMIRYLLDNTQVLLSQHAADQTQAKDAAPADGGGDG